MKLIFPLALLPLSLAVCGAASAQTAPSAGSLNQQIEREQPPRPAKTIPDIRIDPGQAPAAPSANERKILVKQVRITGARVYPEAALLALSGFGGPGELTLSQLRAMAQNIGDHYRKHGYFLAQAYLPAQDIKDGALTIVVLEGQYGQVDLRNSAKVSDGVARELLDGLHSGDTVAIAPLEASLLLLSELPGVNVKSTLVPGASVGASDLIVELLPGAPVSGNVDADNQGNRYTGTNRLGASLYLNNPSGYGDLVSVRLLTSDAGMRYGRLAYQGQIARARAGVAYSRMQYRLGEEFAGLRASGVATVASVYGSYPLLRSRGNNLTAQVNVDAKTFHDRSDATASQSDKKARLAILSLNGDARDRFSGATTYTLSWISGDIDIPGAAARAADAATARTNGRYDKLSFSATRQQSLSGAVSLSAGINGQLASKNLDASEKMGLGGSGGVRAYPSGEAYGDQGYVINLETRVLLPALPERWPGRMQWIGFVDNGSVTVSRNPWAPGTRHRTLSGAGFGLNWANNGGFALSATVARKLGNAPALSAPDRKYRFSLQAITYF